MLTTLAFKVKEYLANPEAFAVAAAPVAEAATTESAAPAAEEKKEEEPGMRAIRHIAASIPNALTPFFQCEHILSEHECC